jgi:ATP adenylyltransferase
MTQADKCPFCDTKQEYRQLVKGEFTYVMYPKSPAIPYHLLIIPIRHVQLFDELSEQEIIEAHKYIKRFVDLGNRNVKDFVGYNILSNNGSTQVSQHVKHCHIHLFLRAKDDIDPVKSSHTKEPEPLSDEQVEYLNEMRNWLGNT